MLRRMGKFGKYLACSNYPECQNILSESKEELSAIRCPKCGENMVYKSGKFGRFLACPSYPDCKSTMSMPSDEEPKLAGKCPECGAAMTVRKSKKGKVYYSCLGYPDCKFMSWDVPTGDKCPDCNSPLVQTARGNVKCSNKDCDYRIKTEKAEKADKKGKKTVPMADDFTPPPLMDEPQYFDFEDDATYFPADIDE